MVFERYSKCIFCLSTQKNMRAITAALFMPTKLLFAMFVSKYLSAAAGGCWNRGGGYPYLACGKCDIGLDGGGCRRQKRAVPVNKRQQ
jgi:hypothetical protein